MKQISCISNGTKVYVSPFPAVLEKCTEINFMQHSFGYCKLWK